MAVRSLMFLPRNSCFYLTSSASVFNGMSSCYSKMKRRNTLRTGALRGIHCHPLCLDNKGGHIQMSIVFRTSYLTQILYKTGITVHIQMLYCSSWWKMRINAANNVVAAPNHRVLKTMSPAGVLPQLPTQCSCAHTISDTTIFQLQ